MFCALSERACLALVDAFKKRMKKKKKENIKHSSRVATFQDDVSLTTKPHKYIGDNPPGLCTQSAAPERKTLKPV